MRAVIDGQPVSFFVTTELDTIMGQNAYGYFYEIEELGIIAQHFRRGSIMLDVGANIGNHTIYAAKFLGARRIICIEPNPEAIMICGSTLISISFMSRWTCAIWDLASRTPQAPQSSLARSR